MDYCRLAIASLVVATMACRGPGEPDGLGEPAFTLVVRGGIYDDGSGRLGMAWLAALRNDMGRGASGAWTGTLSGPSGPLPLTLTYEAPGAGSYATWVLPEFSPTPGVYELTLVSAEGAALRTSFNLLDMEGLSLPQPSLSPDAARLEWALVPGARAYECELYTGRAVQFRALVTQNSCDVSALPPGTYVGSVRAFSADLPALAAAREGALSLPQTFQVSEARLGFVKPGASAPVTRILATGGTYDYGLGSRTLAVWLSIARLDGSPTPEQWDVEVVGPGLPATAPLTFSYWANFPRQMVWSYEVPAAQGSYTLTARSATTTAMARFVVGESPTLDFALDVVAEARQQGSAHASWTPVTGARSYLVSAFDHATGQMAASVWVSGPQAEFAQGSFTAGHTYDIYVAASNVDMVGGAPPTQISVSEDLFGPTSFVAL